MTLRLSYINAQIGAAMPRLVSPLPLGVGANAEPVLAGFLGPNWAEPITITTTWGSDMARSYRTGAQARRQLNDRPSRTIDVQLVGLSNGETYVAHNIAQRHAQSEVPGPIYCDKAKVTAVRQIGTTSTYLIEGDFQFKRFYIGQRILVSKLPGRNFGDHETFLGSLYYSTVQGVSYNGIVVSENTFTPTATQPIEVGDVIYPLMDCRLTLEHAGSALTDEHGTLSLSLRESDGPQALPGSWQGNADSLFPMAGGDFDFAFSLNSKPVYSPGLNWANGIERGFVRQGSENAMGKSGIVKAAGLRPSPTWTLPLAGDREFMWRQLNFFDWARGRAESFWFVDFHEAWEIRKDSNGNSVGFGGVPIAPTAVQIDKTDSLTALRDFWTHIAIILVGETQPFAVRPITSVQDDATSYRISWDDALPSLPWDVFVDNGLCRVAPARLVNFGDDSFEETWLTDDYATSEVVLEGVEEEREVPVDIVLQDDSPSPIPVDAHFSFSAGVNNYELEPGATELVRCSAWPAIHSEPNFVFDTRENLPVRMKVPEDSPAMCLRNASTNQSSLFQFRTDRLNGQRPTILDAVYNYSPIFGFGQELTPDESSLWGTEGWTMMICVTPNTALADYATPMIQVADGSGNLAFEWWPSLSSPGGLSRVRLYDTPGVVNVAYEATSDSFVQPYHTIAFLRWDAATTRLTYQAGTASTTVTTTAPASIPILASVTNLPWFQPFNTAAGPSSAREQDYGEDPGLNALLNVRRAMSVDEINAVANMWAQAFGFSWNDIASV